MVSVMSEVHYLDTVRVFESDDIAGVGGAVLVQGKRGDISPVLAELVKRPLAFDFAFGINRDDMVGLGNTFG